MNLEKKSKMKTYESNTYDMTHHSIKQALKNRQIDDQTGTYLTTLDKRKGWI